ncbi:MAG TPA: HD domain-containing protein [Termitinemataceae bacterium]|jgi:HD-GYP domain-containing protein (c-di-GMP phosphodiesterase class II)|nr:HD domain-containing protein [Termitinemataceae bacterium]HOM22636.1 HD domain-containing protein [Termitinemataceae bacterium]HPP99475.1 HD domain-containing protein [Termitinemataceae bacterium]
MGKKASLEAIIRIDSQLNQIRDADLLLERILFEARQVVGADAGSIYVKEGEMLQIRYAQNDTKQRELPPGTKLLYSVVKIPINEQSIAGFCALHKKVVNVEDAYAIPSNAPYSFNSSYDRLVGYRTRSILAVPLVTPEKKLLGVIQVINKKIKENAVGRFTQKDELFISHFANNATVALERALMTRTMLLRMIRMAELRDPKETGAHVNRVAGYAVEIYERWAFRHNVAKQEREKYKDILRIAAMLHDVGKVAISDVILKKPGPLTPEEYRIMQSHTVYGAHLFDDPQSDLDLVARDIALTHHENWDGSGYPGWSAIPEPAAGALETEGEQQRSGGRKGEGIPLAGRIVAVADVFDALISRRVYKEAWDEEKVYEEIRRLSGTKFDPEIVECFFEALPHIQQVRQLYPDAS